LVAAPPRKDLCDEKPCSENKILRVCNPKHTKEKNRFVFEPFVYFVWFVGKKKKFNDHPFAYRQEIELEIVTLTNLGLGLGRVALPRPEESSGFRVSGSELMETSRSGNPEPGTRNLEHGAQDPKPDLSRRSQAEPETQNPELPPPAAAAGWVVMVPFALPGELVRVRVYRNHKNFSEADLLAVLRPSPYRVAPRCPLFGRCGGCQYQHLAHAEQLRWKQRQVAELLEHMAGVVFPVVPVIASPREFGYRSKITPHFDAPRAVQSSGFRVPGSELSDEPLQMPPPENPEPGTRNPEPGTLNRELGTRNPAASAPSLPIGFLRQGARFEIVDVPRCEIATEAINTRLGEVRAEVQARARRGEFKRGATLLLREASGVVTTDYDAVITETIAVAGLVEAGLPGSTPPATEAGLPGSTTPATTDPTSASLKLHFLARDFFQNNPFILPAFAGYVRTQAAGSGARFLVDAYCGSGLFALSAAPAFERVAGIEISETSVQFARQNAAANGIGNATFQAGDAAAIFAGLVFPPGETVVVIDPPRKGCDESFLRQLFAYGPRAVVYVSCDPATQMRDLRHFLAAGYALSAVQPFDLFPQTRHLECVITLTRA
jgi:23S rRNA (uracil1939-C5)-methyltransferase/tRNA (uracil-5-)-methyltransferase